jgi:hypothetical protein
MNQSFGVTIKEGTMREDVEQRVKVMAARRTTCTWLGASSTSVLDCGVGNV